MNSVAIVFRINIFAYFSRAKVAKPTINLIVLGKKILNVLKYLAFTLLGVFLFWLVYRNQDFTKIWYVLRHEVNYSWIALSLFLGLLSHISRALRWKIALEPLGEKPRTANTFIAVIVSYFMNLLLPRMGEFVRCGLLSKYEKISFTKLLGTVITERVVDVVMVFLIFVLTLTLEFDRFVQFGKENPEIVAHVSKIFGSPWLWVAGFLFVLMMFAYLYIEKKRKKKNLFEKYANEFVLGIKSVFAMKRYKAYIAHSVFIWLMYYLMIYVTFFSVDFTSHLNMLSALTTFIMSSMGMFVPVQAGIGAWHFMAEKALGLYGVASENGKLFALIAHTSTNLLVVVLGAISIVVLPLINKGYKGKTEKAD